MRSTYRAAAFTISLFAATLAGAQQSAPAAGGNALQRSDKNSFYYGTIHGSSPITADTGIGRPVTRYAPVTPVPEPSQWLMMLAGLGLVGFIIRRSSKRD
jgi:PEP-CTERM motif-containing protein